MKAKNRIIFLVSVIALFSVLVVTVVGATVPGGFLSETWQNSEEKSGVIKYEKPGISEIVNDGNYPDEIKSESSANAQEKEWYEYITYSKKSIGEIKAGNKKLVFYDPYDYTYGMVMEISDFEGDFGDFYDSEGYTTANEITISYSKSKSHSWASEFSLDLGYEESFESKVEASVSATLGNEWASAGTSATIGSSIGLKFSQNVGVSHTQSGSDDSQATKSVTYNAVHFNSEGTPYRWRIVKYTVYLPLYCEAQMLINDEWVVTETNYCLLATVEGTCREWINNVAYIEDWRTGEPYQVENFWKEFFTKDKLVEAYLKKLIPVN